MRTHLSDDTLNCLAEINVLGQLFCYVTYRLTQVPRLSKTEVHHVTHAYMLLLTLQINFLLCVCLLMLLLLALNMLPAL